MTGLSHTPKRSLNNKTGTQKCQNVNTWQEYRRFNHCPGGLSFPQLRGPWLQQGQAKKWRRGRQKGNSEQRKIGLEQLIIRFDCNNDSVSPSFFLHFFI